PVKYTSLCYRDPYRPLDASECASLVSHFAFIFSWSINLAPGLSDSSIACLISLICHSLTSIYSFMASRIRYDLERDVDLANLSSRSFVSSSILTLNVVLIKTSFTISQTHDNTMQCNNHTE